MGYLDGIELVARQQGTHQFDRLMYDMKASPGFLPWESYDVTMTSTELLALYTTSKTILPAPGAGLINIFHGCFTFLDYGTTAYDGIHTDEDISIRYTDSDGLQIGEVEATGFLDATADEFRYTPTSSVVAIQPIANGVIVMAMETGNIATGDSPLYIRSYYSTIPASLPYI